MFQGMDPKLVKQAMKKMGMKQEEIDAIQVIIKLKDNKELVINNPEVQKVEMMGQESFQVSGQVEERALINEDDIKLIMEQGKVNEKKAKEALEKANGDIAKAILELQNT